MTAGTKARRKTRANGEESRQKILDAATAIASERGYEGTSISLVSARSGLPASSIYWHFKDKDGLIAAVIERSFGEWLAAAGGGPDESRGSVVERLAAGARRTAKALETSPDFLRLGLMLALERRPDEATARAMFLQVREEAHKRTVQTYRHQFPELDDNALEQLATLSMALADGLFIAREINGDRKNLLQQYHLQAAAVAAAAEHLRGSRSG